MVVESFVPSVNQSIETGIKEIRFQVTEPVNDSFLNFGIGFEMATCQALLQRSKDIKITWPEILAVGRIFQNIPFENAVLTFREQFRSFPVKCLVQRDTITGSIHVRSKRMEINQQLNWLPQKTRIITFFGDGTVFNFLWGWTRGVS
ncbi:hypothetical protein AVEN_24261-1 [Araneus ventricosus]|uniref:Uncharacterized protein n=1 Tax=Araneus ventricosus TaxID=182803 RepID=A0A4Y2LLH0_ARAVE|nr:hypothetical protein AVEN_24261-1 [Araneus ventricosus]